MSLPTRHSVSNPRGVKTYSCHNCPLHLIEKAIGNHKVTADTILETISNCTNDNPMDSVSLNLTDTTIEVHCTVDQGDLIPKGFVQADNRVYDLSRTNTGVIVFTPFHH